MPAPAAPRADLRRAAVGLGRAVALPQHVGALLQRRERDCVRARVPYRPAQGRLQADAPPRLRCRRFVVDAADQNTLEVARGELHNLLKKQDGKENPLAGIPLLVRRARACSCRETRLRLTPLPQVLGNKKDLPGALTERELIDRMDLQSLAQEREVCTYCISCKNVENIDITIDWLTKHSRGRS